MIKIITTIIGFTIGAKLSSLYNKIKRQKQIDYMLNVKKHDNQS